ncbi:hypothetical protein CBP51_07080 [Cellvibrio mixtus]|uniref:Uncharacterized protein n=1 Tax=Cellvibrio mixtus TaxID=39650 RepID=A0A266QA47_9GAMM|nr:hypothetical protein [Cellvibrio mixtus]OZY86767.1 hypothetical protein CBP51_07080 [Cellvibrio mixtus]
MFKKIVFSVSTFILSFSAQAAEFDYDIKVHRIGVDNDDKAYIRPVGQFTHQCAHNVIFFSLSSPSGKSFLTLITSAKLADKKLAIVSYEVNSSNQCWLISVEVE